jgi:fluoride exporter
VSLLIIVGIGGAAGSIARFLVSTWVQHRSLHGFPWGTYTVNGTGSFAIGIVFGLFDGGVYSGDALTFLVSGILGGYTTFSTFSVENLKLIERRRYGMLIHNTAGQVTGCLLLAVVGYWLGSLMT